MESLSVSLLHCNSVKSTFMFHVRTKFSLNFFSQHLNPWATCAAYLGLQLIQYYLICPLTVLFTQTQVFPAQGGKYFLLRYVAALFTIHPVPTYQYYREERLTKPFVCDHREDPFNCGWFLLICLVSCPQSEAYERRQDPNGMYMKHLLKHVTKDIKVEDVLHQVAGGM